MDKTVYEEVAERIGKLGPDVREGVVKLQVQRQLDKRVDAVNKVMELRDRHRQDMYRIKPDNCTYNDTGDLITEGWTKDGAKKLREAKELLEKYERSIDKALNKADFTDVYSLANTKES